jgi:hypothetical protein
MKGPRQDGRNDPCLVGKEARGWLDTKLAPGAQPDGNEGSPVSPPKTNPIPVDSPEQRAYGTKRMHSNLALSFEN